MGHAASRRAAALAGWRAMGGSARPVRGRLLRDGPVDSGSAGAMLASSRVAGWQRELPMWRSLPPARGGTHCCCCTWTCSGSSGQECFVASSSGPRGLGNQSVHRVHESAPPAAIDNDRAAQADAANAGWFLGVTGAKLSSDIHGTCNMHMQEALLT